MIGEHISAGTEVHSLQIGEVEQVLKGIEVIIEAYGLSRSRKILHIIVAKSIVLTQLLLEVSVHHEVLSEFHRLEVDSVGTAFYQSRTTQRDILAHVDISHIYILLIKDILGEMQRVGLPSLIGIGNIELNDAITPIAHEQQQVILIEIILVETLCESRYGLMLVGIRASCEFVVKRRGTILSDRLHKNTVVLIGKPLDGIGGVCWSDLSRCYIAVL